jgi:hypothetical protein
MNESPIKGHVDDDDPDNYNYVECKAIFIFLNYAIICIFHGILLGFFILKAMIPNTISLEIFRILNKIEIERQISVGKYARSISTCNPSVTPIPLGIIGAIKPAMVPKDAMAMLSTNGIVSLVRHIIRRPKEIPNSTQ